MKIKSIFIDNYKLLKNVKINFDNQSELGKKYSSLLYKNMNITLLVGANGSGKTTLMSFIANIFHNLERYHTRIPSDFVLIYEIGINGEPCEVTIKKINDQIYIKAENYIDEARLVEWHPRKGDLIPRNVEKYVTYDDIRIFLPTKIITSIFSMHGEYPSPRPSNYIGDRIIDTYNIANIYGSNHYAMTSVSQGIFNFLIRYYLDEDKIKKYLLDSLNLKFYGDTIVRLNYYPFVLEDVLISKGSSNENKWISIAKDLGVSLKAFIDFSFLNLSESLKENHEDEDIGILNFNKYCNNHDYNLDLLHLFNQENQIYFNDLIFERDGNKITLSNMSSGEKMLILRLLSLLSSAEDEAILLIEEPELHLNPSWKKQFMSMLAIFFGHIKTHCIISSHDYAITNSLINENILLLEKGKAICPEFNTLLANESQITSHLFEESLKPNLIEDILLKYLSEGKISDVNNLYNFLGESFLKFYIYNKLIKKDY